MGELVPIQGPTFSPAVRLVLDDPSVVDQTGERLLTYAEKLEGLMAALPDMIRDETSCRRHGEEASRLAGSDDVEALVEFFARQSREDTAYALAHAGFFR
jgi:hypothetical protein